MICIFRIRICVDTKYLDNVEVKILNSSLDVATVGQNIVSMATVGKRHSLTLNKLI